ncbi:MAG: hypothetical protein GY811_23080 [Myxococcales bacterium]|nr:hypothetical protein [Myxococcales bacterium]
MSGLNYYGYRYYDELSLSWTQADPLYLIAPGLGADEPRRANLYSFSLNNPVRYLDPDGADAADVLLQARRLEWMSETNTARTTASDESVNAVINFMNLPTKAFSSAKIGNIAETEGAMELFTYSNRSITIDPLVFGPVTTIFNSRQADLYTGLDQKPT